MKARDLAVNGDKNKRTSNVKTDKVQSGNRLKPCMNESQAFRAVI